MQDTKNEVPALAYADVIQYRFGTTDSTITTASEAFKARLAGAGEFCLGIIGAAALAGRPTNVRTGGMYRLTVNGSGTAINAGDKLKSAANGIGIKAGATDEWFAIAIDPSTGNGDIIRVVIAHGNTGATTVGVNTIAVAGATGALTDDDLTNKIVTVLCANNGVCALAAPDPATVEEGSILIVKKTGTAGAVTITPDANTIAGAAAHALITAQGDSCIFVATPTDWTLLVDETGAGESPVFATTSASATTAALTAAQISGKVASITLSVAGVAALALPGAATVTAGTQVTVKKTGTVGAVTITPAAGTIAGASTHALITAQNDSCTFMALGTDWVLLIDETEARESAVFGYTSSSATTAAVTAAQISGKSSVLVLSANGVAALAIPSAALVISGTQITVKKTGSAGAITITPAAGTIAGGATHTALDAQNDVATFAALGTDWVLLNSVIA